MTDERNDDFRDYYKRLQEAQGPDVILVKTPPDVDYLPNYNVDEQEHKLNKAYLSGELPGDPLVLDEAEAARRRASLHGVALLGGQPSPTSEVWGAQLQKVLGPPRIIDVDNPRLLAGDAAIDNAVRATVDENLRGVTVEGDGYLGDVSVSEQDQDQDEEEDQEPDNDLDPSDDGAITTAADITAEGLSPPPTHEAREAELTEIKDRIDTNYSLFERALGDAAQYAVAMGVDLINARAILPHRRFKAWIKENYTDKGKFSYSSARHYMLAVVAKVKNATLVFLPKQGAAEAITDLSTETIQAYVAKREARENAKWKKRIEEDPEAAKAEYQAEQEARNRNRPAYARTTIVGADETYGKRGKKKSARFKAFQADAPRRKEVRDQLQADLMAIGLANLNKLRPHLEMGGFLIEATQPDPESAAAYPGEQCYMRIRFFGWLPENAKMDAFAETLRINAKADGGQALKYKWIEVRQAVVSNTPRGVGSSYGFTVKRKEGTWAEMQTRILEVFKDNTHMVRADPFDPDPDRLDLLDLISPVEFVRSGFEKPRPWAPEVPR